MTSQPDATPVARDPATTPAGPDGTDDLASAPSADRPEAASGSDAGEPGWADYYRYTLGREPRPLFAKGLEAMQAAGAGPGTAIDIGAGDGTESLRLLEAGWRVLAVDSAPESAQVIEPRVPAAQRHRLELVTGAAQELVLPPLDLAYSAYVLPYLERDAFHGLWRNLRARLNPGGFLVVNLFGDRHGWAGTEPDATFLARRELDPLLAGLDVVVLDEIEEDGGSFTGPVHWHVFDIVARQPG